IVTWEWDFTYDPDDGFQIDSTEKGPVQASTIEGVFLVQHRVEDSGGLSDLLDEPLVIIVELGPKAPVAAAHVDDYEISAGDFLQFFDDSTDPNGQEDIVLWEWDFSFDPDDGFNVESTEIEPLVEFSQVGIFDVQFRVTDSTDLSDMLDEPLLITVIHDHPAASYGFTFGDDLNNDEAIGIGVDPEGRVYVTGDFVNTVDFDPSEDVHEMTAIRRSGYVVKYDQADFQVLDSAQWDGTYSYNEYQADVDSFSSDGNGNFYITGTCQHNPVTPRATYIRSITPSNLNNWVAYEKNWYYLNWFLWHEASCEYDYSPVACGNDGNIFYFVNTICKGETWYYSPEGSYLNATLLKRTPSGIEEVFLELDPYEFINTFNSVEVNQHGVFTFVHNWSDESFIRHFSLDGSLQWELGFGPQENIQYTMAESDDAGNVYFTGFNDNTLTKISPDGEILLELSWDASAEDIYIHPDGSFLVTGTFTGTVDFDPGSDVKLRSSAGTTSGYVSAFDPDGNFLWVETWGDSEEMYAKSLTTDDSGIIYVCGYFSGSIDLGPPWQSDIHYSNGWTDAFVLKLSQ
ncbi:hypothetical protein KAU08_01225, partial [bacterium]|nr:hypothetical protein [bacterium]